MSEDGESTTTATPAAKRSRSGTSRAQRAAKTARAVSGASTDAASGNGAGTEGAEGATPVRKRRSYTRRSKAAQSRFIVTLEIETSSAGLGEATGVADTLSGDGTTARVISVREK